MKRLCLQSDPSWTGERIDKFLAEVMKDYSRSFLQKQFKEGNITVNGKPAKASLKVGEEDERCFSPGRIRSRILSRRIYLWNILYEDDQLLVVNKPKGMVVHPSAGHYSGYSGKCPYVSLQGQSFGDQRGTPARDRYRIDMDTTGSLVVCKTDTAHQSLAEQLKVHSITRRYRAIVHGNIKEDTGTVEGSIGRHPVERKKMAVNVRGGKEAVTHFKVLERFGSYTYV